MKVLRQKQKTKNNLIKERHKSIKVLRNTRRKEGFRSTLRNNKHRINKLISILSVVLAIVLFVFIAYVSFQSESLKIKQIEVYGGIRVQNESVKEYLNVLMDRSFISVNQKVLTSDIKKQFSEVYDVSYIREFPSKLKVEIIEKSPVAIYLTIDTIKLIGDNAEVVGEIQTQTLPLTASEQEVVSGNGNPNADYIRLRLQSKAQGAFTWDGIPIEERQVALDEMKSEVESKIKTNWDGNLSKIQESQYKDLPIIYRKVLGELKIDLNRLNNSLNWFEALKLMGFIIKGAEILNVYDVAFDLDSGKRIIVTSRIERSFENQKHDIEVLIENRRIDSGTIFDFRSSNYSIK
jgi:hypothetical protein